MLTSASTAAVESVTRPETEAFVDCAFRTEFSEKRTRSAKTDTRRMSQPADLETLSVNHEVPVSSKLRASRAVIRDALRPRRRCRRRCPDRDFPNVPTHRREVRLAESLAEWNLQSADRDHRIVPGN